MRSEEVLKKRKGLTFITPNFKKPPMVPKGVQQLASKSKPFKRSYMRYHTCPHYGKSHRGEACWRMTGTCLRCRKMGHYWHNCPLMKEGVESIVQRKDDNAMLLWIMK